MITGWKNREALLDEYRFPGFCPRAEIQGIFGDPRARVIQLKRTQKKRYGAVAAQSIAVITTRRCGGYGICPAEMHGLFGGGSSAGIMPEVWEGEAGEDELACGQSFLHKAVCLLCGAEVSGDDGQGCGEGIEVGLAYGEGAGQGVHGGATSSESGCGAWGDRD